MGDPLDMADEEEPKVDERPIGEEELNAIVSALSKNRPVEVAYVDAHLVRSGRQVRVLVDSGNLVGDLVSKAFADSLGLQYKPDCRPIATASTEGQLMAIGECNPMQLKVKGLDQVFTVQPLVVEGLSREMNVGRDFLGRNKCALVFNTQGGELRVGGPATALLPRRPEAWGNLRQPGLPRGSKD